MGITVALFASELNKKSEDRLEELTAEAEEEFASSFEIEYGPGWGEEEKELITKIARNMFTVGYVYGKIPKKKP